MFRLKYAARAALLLAVAACTGDVTAPSAKPGDTGPSQTISDAAHAGAVPGFYFLPPMVPAPSYSGTFDGGLQPTVEICEFNGPTCTTIATFNATVNLAAQTYQVNWHTNQFNLDPAKTYRISVYVGTFRLGFADVDVVSSGKELKNVDTQQFIPLQDDRTLPIKFRIETGIAGQVIVTPDSASIPVGGTQQFTATVLDLHGNPLAASVTWSSSDTGVATVDGTGLATGVSVGQATITAAAQAASDSATLTVFNPNTPPVANPDTFDAIGNVTVPVAAPGVLANDTDGESNPLSAVPGTFPTAAGGTVTINADGSFSYLSAAGFTGQDSFEYAVTDGLDSATATVTVVSAYRVWYVDNAGAAPGDGRDASPFTTLKAAETASAVGETIFLRYGNGTSAGYDDGIILKTGQSLTGQGVPANVTATLNGQTVVLLAAGSAPTVTRASGATVQVSTNNVIQGFDVGSADGAGIAGTGFGTLTVGSMSVAANGGPALDLSSGDVFGAFGSLSATTATGAGIHLLGVGGSFSAAGGTITVTGAATAGVDVTGGAGTFSYGGDIVATGPLAVFVANRTGGALTFGGTIASTGSGIGVQNNSGGTIAFNGASKTLSTGANDGVQLLNNAGATVSFGGGGLVIGTTTGTGFEATGGGTVTVTGAGNTIVSAGGTALQVENTTIGGSGLSFRSISASGGPNGIALLNTGALNGLQVTGTGTAGSGGTIQNMSGDGVSLADATNVFFSYVDVVGTGGSGVRGTGVVNFRFTDGSILNSGTALGTGESNIAFNTTASGTENNLSGTVTISRNTLGTAYYHGVDIVNFSGTLTDVEIAGNTVTSATSTAASLGSGIRLLARGSATVRNAAIQDNAVRNFPSGAGIHAEGGNGSMAGPAGIFGVPGSASEVIAITGNRISGQPSARLGTSAIIALVNGRGVGNFDISDNGTAADPITNVTGTAILHSALGQVTVTTTIARNRIVANNSFAAQGIGVGADQVFGVTDAPDLTVNVVQNVVSATDGVGIQAVARNSAATMRARVQNNVVSAPLTGSRQGIRIDSGSTLGNTTVCLNISGNQSAGGGTALGIGLRKQGTNPAVNVFGVNGMVATATPAVEAYVSGLNPAGGGTQLISATSGFSNCSLP